MESFRSKLNCILRMTHHLEVRRGKLLIRQPSMQDNICLKKWHSHLQGSETILFALDNSKDSFKVNVNNFLMRGDVDSQFIVLGGIQK